MLVSLGRYIEYLISTFVSGFNSHWHIKHPKWVLFLYQKNKEEEKMVKVSVRDKETGLFVGVIEVLTSEVAKLQHDFIIVKVGD